MKYEYDLLVIGSGSAGFAAASSARGVGRKIVIVEATEVGGECPNFGCVPSKALLLSAKRYRCTKRNHEFGIAGESTEFDIQKAMQRKDALVRGLSGQRVVRVAEELGVDIIKGRAVFLDEHTVMVGKRNISSGRFIIAVGSIPKEPKIRGLSRGDYWTYRDALSATVVPEKLLIVGGGPIGVEMATYFGSIGSKIVLVEHSAQLLGKDEPEISKVAEESLASLGADVFLNSEVVEVITDESGVKTAQVRTGNSIKEFSANSILFAAGKEPNLFGLGLQAAGVSVDESGKVKVDSELRTNIKHIWSAGDVNGGLMFTHLAHYEGSVAGWNAFSDNPQKINEEIVPRVVFSDPEIASVGETESVARKNRDVITSVFPLAKLGRAYIDGEARGLVKLVAEKKSRKIIGGHIASPHAGEMIHEVALAIHAGMTVDDLAMMIHAYPTYSEAISASAGAFQN